MMSDEPGSVTEWLRNLEGDDSDAAQKLWNRFFDKLLERAESLLRENNQHKLEGEDIASEVLASLWKGARAGRFRDVKNRDELWWLLLAITRMTMVDGIRKESARKRGGDVTVLALDGKNPAWTYKQLVSHEPSPEDAFEFAEEVSRLLSLLRDDRSRQVAVLWMEGCTQQEIADQAGISTATVTRKLRLIRQTWQVELIQ